MSLSTQQLLDTIDALITAAGDAGGVVEFSHETERYRQLSLAELLRERRLLVEQLAAEAGCLSLYQPLREN